MSGVVQTNIIYNEQENQSPGPSAAFGLASSPPLFCSSSAVFDGINLDEGRSGGEEEGEGWGRWSARQQSNPFKFSFKFHYLAKK